MNNKSREIIEDLITDYIEDLEDLYDAGFKNPLLDKKKEIRNIVKHGRNGI